MLRIALLIAVIAVAEAGVGLVARWLSASIGEALILDLRRVVFEHVQRMPIAFFTRTRTGALVSRLNNDVIGAQRAFSDTLSGFVGNLVALVLTLIAMLALSWQITLLSLMLLPVFVLPARRFGRRLARLELEAANHNSVMSTQMTERFSAPGATLVKLFAVPERETAEFVARATRVRDIGVRTAMVQVLFVTALTLVSALALALVYGLGGWYALQGTLDAGDVVALALLLTRLYAPLTGAGQRSGRGDERAGQLRAGLRGARPRAADRRSGPTPATVPDGRCRSSSTTCTSPTPRPTRSRWPRWRRSPPSTPAAASRSSTGSRSGPSPGSSSRWSARPAPVSPRMAQLLARLYDVDSGRGPARRCRRARPVLRLDPPHARDGYPGRSSFPRHGPGQPAARSPDATDDELWEALERARLDDLVRSLPDGLDTVVGERGYRLSGGERQRLTIARLLLAHPRVVLLDEATAHLDSTSEAAVQAALTEALAGRTAIVIAHRLSTIRAADQILVVEAGRIVERGASRGPAGSRTDATPSCTARSSPRATARWTTRHLSDPVQSVTPTAAARLLAMTMRESATISLPAALASTLFQ